MDALPTILVTGVVPRLDRLRELGRVKRAGWTAVARESAGPDVALAILGSAPAHVDTRAVMAEIRNEPAASAVPLVHLAGHDAACEGCRADVCLPAVTRPETLLGVTRTLLTLRRDPWATSHAAEGVPARAVPGSQPMRLEEIAGRDPASMLIGLLQATPGIVYLVAPDEERLAYASPGVEGILGYTPTQLLAMSPAASQELVDAEDRARILRASVETPEGRPFETELRVRASDGRWRTLRSRSIALGAADGKPARLLGVATDVTDERETRRMLERAQRLEALGQLTGGIAHDFNNLLGVITGHSQLAQRLLPRDHPASSGIEQVLQASERAAALAQQLLSLSRGQSRGPRPLDLNTVVDGVAAMLRRVISEDVEFELHPGAGLWPIEADPSEIEQVLLNLALNARDAMPLGGRLGIGTRNAEVGEEEAGRLGLRPGPHVVLAVSDSGVGMDVQTRERIFEPFFTTKPEGRGSGLGLATVRGIVERCAGVIRVDSVPEAGTTFTIYLPRGAEPASPERAQPTSRAPGGRETILLVEDADPVREVTRELLEGLGYTVLAAAHGSQALALARAYPGAIHVLLTDVVMPGLGGDTLAAEVASLRPKIRVVYMSGYATDTLPRHAAPGLPLLPKPFTRDRLAQAVRQALDRPEA